MSIVRAAVVQDFPVVFDREATLVKVRELAHQAAARGAELVVFPEAFVSGYPKGLDFGARIGMRLPGVREDFRRYFQSAVDIPGPAIEALGAAAKESRVHLVIGVIDRELGILLPGRAILGGQLLEVAENPVEDLVSELRLLLLPAAQHDVILT